MKARGQMVARTSHSSIAQRQAAWTGLLAATTVLLMLPAFYNRFPLVFPDVEAYFAVAYASAWTADRSGFYGFLLKPVLMPLDAKAGWWLAAALQAAAIAGILLLGARRLLPQSTPATAFLLLAAAAAATSLPWHASQLMPDAFAGPLVLLVWIAASRPADAPGSPLLWLGVTLLTLLHYTYIGLTAVAAAATLAICAGHGIAWADLAKRALAALLALAAVVAAHVSFNGSAFGQWSFSPGGSLFLFARLNEDGLVPQWLDRHCGRDAPEDLCRIRHSLPSDSQVLLWGAKKSPITAYIHDQPGSPEFWRWIDMFDQAAMGSIREQPLAFARSAAGGTARQLVQFQVLDDECPQHCLLKHILHFRPSLADRLARTRQVQGTMPKATIRAVTGAVTWFALLLLPVLLWQAYRRRDSMAQALLVAITAALLANAAMAGALSDVHDRYQSRLVWLAPFAALVLIARWYGRGSTVVRAREPRHRRDG